MQFNKCYQGIGRPDPLPPGGWAAKIHVACTPVYYHAYLLGAAVASQLAHHLPGGARLGEPGLGAHLREVVFQPSATTHWRERMREATGHDVSAKWLLADLGVGERKGGRPDASARR